MRANQFITEEQFAKMVQGMKQGTVKGSLASRHTQTERTTVRRKTLSVGRVDGANPSPSPISPTSTSQTFFVPGPLPGANDIIRKHWRVYSKLKQEWGLTIARCLMVAKLKPVQSCSIRYHWVEPTPVRGHIRDRDNIRFGAKFINDAIVTHGILLDDGPDGVTGLSDTFEYHADNPGVWVTLKETP